MSTFEYKWPLGWFIGHYQESFHQCFYSVECIFHAGDKYGNESLILNPNVPAGWVGKVQKKNLPNEEGREGGEKIARSAPAWAQGLNPGPAAC